MDTCANSCKRGYGWLCRIRPIQKNKIVFSNFLGKGYGDNPKYITEEILREKLPWDVVWLSGNAEQEYPQGVRVVPYGSLKAMYELATAKVWVDNVRNTLRPAKRKGQVYLQTWHGSYGPKLSEKDAEDKLSASYVKAAKADGRIADAVLTNSYMLEKFFVRAFWLGDNAQILRLGFPKNDVMLQNAASFDGTALKKKLGISNDAYVVLYAPTFRDSGSTEGYITDFAPIVKAFEENLGKPCVVLVKLHPNAKSQRGAFSYGEKVIDASDSSDIQELSLISDLLISDYSSTPFDFTLLHKPAMLCTLDYEDYKRERGLVEDFLDYPFPIARTMEEMVRNVSDFSPGEYETRMEAYRAKNPMYDMGDASRKTVEWIRSRMTE